jgi:hypothetical protein
MKLLQIMVELFASWKFIAVALAVSFILYIIFSIGSVNRNYRGPKGAARKKKAKLPKPKKEKPKPTGSKETNEEDEEPEE